MKSEILNKTVDVGDAAARVKAEVERVKEVVADAVENGIDATRRAVKQGRRRADDLIGDAEYQVKRRPMSAVGITFGVGLGLGAVIGILLARNGHSGK